MQKTVRFALVQVKRHYVNDKKQCKKKCVLQSFETTFGALPEVLCSGQWAAARWYKSNLPFRDYNIYRNGVWLVPPRSTALYGGGGGHSSGRYLMKNPWKKARKRGAKTPHFYARFDHHPLYLLTCTTQKCSFFIRCSMQFPSLNDEKQ